MIPPVTRTAGASADSASLILAGRTGPVYAWRRTSCRSMIEYVKLCQQGDSTIEARMLLLKEQMETLLEQKAQIESTIKRLDFKISRYEEAVKTGKLTWE